MAQILPNNFVRYPLSHSHLPPCWPDALSLAHCLPSAPQHGLGKLSTVTPGNISDVVEERPKADTKQSVIIEDDVDGLNGESIQICLVLRKNIDVLADVDRDSSVNWISEKLLRDSGIDIVPTKYMTIQGPRAIRLESEGSAKVLWRRSPSDKTILGGFIVHAGKPGAPDLLLGKTWAEAHGESVIRSQQSGKFRGRNAQRQHEGARCGDIPHMRTGSLSVSGRRTMQLAERQGVNRRFVNTSRR